LHLSEAHRLASGRGVRIAVIDSQIDANHPEIQGAVTERFDALEADMSGRPKTDSQSGEPQKHGTGMAGAISGHSRIDGVAPQAEILAVRAFSDAARASSLDVLASIDWAATHKAQVVNMSFAGPKDPLLTEMLAAAAQRGLVLIAAAGNDGPQAPPAYPAADPHVIAVSAVDEQAKPYAMANRGAYVSLAAPGVDVLVAAPRGAYDLSTGTSVACAEVSGIAALLLERHPGLDGPALRGLLRASARSLESGAGLADAAAAVERRQ
jgi:subtilisin family serine protease